MLKDRGRRLAGLRKRTFVMAAMALMIVPVTALASASPAAAEPMGIFKIFKECPTEVPGVTLCSVDNTTSGEVKLGNTGVPITKTITQQGGLIPTGNPENEREFFAYPAKNGESLSKVALNVPGGLLDFIKCESITGSGLIEIALRELCKFTFEHGSTEVTATTELAATEKNPVILNEEALNSEEGTALTLPIKVHLKNSLLGNSCYIGSEAEPIELHLTTGATTPAKGVTPLHGKKGTPSTEREKGLLVAHIKENTQVDNTFSAPKAYGCGEVTILGIKFTGGLDFLVEGKLGIPNKNTKGEDFAIFNGELAVATAEHVIESESF
jgi:hypothetical protein